MHRGMVVSAAVLVGSLLGLFVADRFFFEPILRRVLKSASSRTTMELRFDTATGSFFEGKAELSGVKLKREKHRISNFDFEIKTITFDLSVRDLLQSRGYFEELRVQGVRGAYERVSVPDRLKARRPFTVEQLSIEDIQLEFTDRTRKKRCGECFVEG